MAVPRKLPELRWVLFDAVGTLIYAVPAAAEVYWSAATRRGSRLSIGEVGRRFTAALRDEQSQLGFERPPTNDAAEQQRWRRIVGAAIDDADDPERLFTELWQHFGQPASWRVYNDVAATFEQLRHRHFRIGIASNFDSRLKDVVAGHAVLARSEPVFVSSEVGYSKPDPRFFSEVQRRIGVEATALALVGDDEINDVAGAAAAGWYAVHLVRECIVHSPTAIRSLRDLL